MSPTSSRRGVRLGSQRPRVRKVPHYRSTLGGEVVDFMAEIGRPLDLWQAAIVRDAFAIDRAGKWTIFELLLLLSRQNGKGGVTEAIELGGLFLFGDPLIMHSAHQFKTSTAAFRRLIDIIDASDWLTRRVKMISRSKGDESIELTRAAGGGRLQFVARTLGSGRGFTGAKTVFDEAAWLTVGQYAAQTPALATIPNPQIIYTSTPPDEDVGPMPEDAMLPSVRKRGMRGGRRVALYEWSPPKVFDRTDSAVWYDTNPALGIRIEEWFLHQQLAAFTEAGHPEKFDTEHLGLWPEDEVSQWQVISEGDWLSGLDVQSRPTDPVAFAADATPDQSRGDIAVFGGRADGLEHVEIVDHRSGTAWIPGRLLELRDRWNPCAIVIDPKRQASPHIAELEAAGVEVVKPTARDMAQACGGFYAAVADSRSLRHRGQPELSAALARATKRKLEGAWAWDGHEISPLVAATLARWGHATRAHLRSEPMFAWA